MLFWTLAAWAAEPNFAPDRPGVGDSTGTPGAGHVLLEGGVASTLDPFLVGTSGLVGRFGVDDGLELRLRAPDLTFGDGVAVGTVGLGAKVAATAGERWSVSAVPEVFIDPQTGDVGGSVGANIAFGVDRLGLWGHGSVASVPGPTLGALFGGGASVSLGSGGLYANGGVLPGAGGFGGGGGWWGLSDSAQIDAGCDAFIVGGTTTPVFGLGASVVL